MIESSYITPILRLLVSQDTFHAIDTDPMLSVKRYEVDGVELCIATNSKKLFSPALPHQMLAKGLVYTRTMNEYGGYSYQLVAMPYTKIYNSFEGPALRDAELFSGMTGIFSTLVRKMDGTLVARWVYKGNVYFSTRGRIISLDKNEFYDLTMQVINQKGYTILLDPEFASGATIIMELVGPSNIVLELHPEDDLVVTGLYSVHKNVYLDPNLTTIKDSGLTMVETYDSSNPEEVIASFSGIQEGVIQNFYANDNNSGSLTIIGRIKYKSEDYIKALKAGNIVSKTDLIELAIEHDYVEWIEVKAHFERLLVGHPFREELIEVYREEWNSAYGKLVDIYALAKTLGLAAMTASSYTNRKECFFFLREAVGETYAGFLMGVIDGKHGTKDILRKVARAESN